MCGGPTSAQTELQQEEANFYKTQIQAYHQAYGQFSELQDVLKQQFAPILARGAGQMGYTPDELTTLRTQATEGTAANFAAAQRGLQQRIAAEGGGTSNVNLTGGPSQQIQAELASATAAESSRENLGITTSGYDLGRQMWGEAVKGTEGLAAGWNPNQFASSTVSAGNSAADEANQIAKLQNSAWGPVLSALGGIAGNVSSPSLGGWKLNA